MFDTEDDSKIPYQQLIDMANRNLSKHGDKAHNFAPSIDFRVTICLVTATYLLQQSFHNPKQGF